MNSVQNQSRIKMRSGTKVLSAQYTNTLASLPLRASLSGKRVHVTLRSHLRSFALSSVLSKDDCIEVRDEFFEEVERTLEGFQKRSQV